MNKDTRSRRYMITINNPENEYTHEILKSKLNELNLTYYCMADEIGLECKTPHTHIFFTSTNAIRFSTLKKMFTTAHIETANASNIECRNYVGKFGKWLDDEKADTRVEGSFEEWGEMKIENQGHRSDWEIARQMIEDGFSVFDVQKSMPHMMRYSTSLEQYRQKFIEKTYIENMISNYNKINVTYIYGGTGLGKTRYVINKYKNDDVYRVTNYKNAFDNYNGEYVMIFDEFDCQFSITELNNYLDGYKVFLPCRYADKFATFTNVYIISNVRIENLYLNEQKNNKKKQLVEAFRRRIDNIIVYCDQNTFIKYTTNEYFEKINNNKDIFANNHVHRFDFDEIGNLIEFENNDDDNFEINDDFENDVDFENNDDLFFDDSFDIDFYFDEGEHNEIE